jgi:hypothetical protein
MLSTVQTFFQLFFDSFSKIVETACHENTFRELTRDEKALVTNACHNFDMIQQRHLVSLSSVSRLSSSAVLPTTTIWGRKLPRVLQDENHAVKNDIFLSTHS